MNGNRRSGSNRLRNPSVLAGDPWGQWLKENRLAIGLVWLLNTIVGVAIGMADYPFLDDVARRADGGTHFAEHYSRWGSEIMSVTLNGNHHLADLGLGSFFICGAIVTLTTTIVFRTLFPRRVPWFAAVASVIIGINPWAMELWSFRFDNIYMFTSLFFAVFPFLWWGRWRVFTPLAAISVFIGHNFYQQSSGLVIVMTIVLVYRDLILRRVGWGFGPAFRTGIATMTGGYAAWRSELEGNRAALRTAKTGGEEAEGADETTGAGAPARHRAAEARRGCSGNLTWALISTILHGIGSAVWFILKGTHRALNTPWGHSVAAAVAFGVGTAAYKYETTLNPGFADRPQTQAIAPMDQIVEVIRTNIGLYIKTVWTLMDAQWHWLAAVSVIGSVLVAVWAQRTRSLRWVIGAIVGSVAMVALSLALCFGILLAFITPMVQTRPRYGGYCVWVVVAVVVLVAIASRQLIDEADNDRQPSSNNENSSFFIAWDKFWTAVGRSKSAVVVESLLRGVTATVAVMLTGAFLVFGWTYAGVLSAEKENFEEAAVKLYTDVGPLVNEERHTLCVSTVAPSSTIYLSSSHTFPFLLQLLPTTHRVYFPTTMWFNQVNHTDLELVQCNFNTFHQKKQDETTPKYIDRPDRTVWADDTTIYVEDHTQVIIPPSEPVWITSGEGSDSVIVDAQ